MTALLRSLRLSRLGAPLALVAGAFSTACEESAFTLQPKTTITVSPPHARLPVGDSLLVRVAVNGRPCDCLWTSHGALSATVNATGLVRAQTPGTAIVTATWRHDASAKVSVLVDVVAP